MKRETMQNKLAEILGLDQFKVDTDAKKKSASKATEKFVGITEDEIQSFRAAQGLVYFLQAPELFSLKTCPHCTAEFLVSRQYVAFCSYTCISKDLEAKGIKWTKGEDIDSLITAVYDGNEPIWVRNVDRIRQILDTLPERQLLVEASN